MKIALRVLAGVFAGFIVAFILVIAVELFGSVVHPLPEDFGGTMEEMCQHVERFPPWVLAVAGLLWAATAFAGTWTAQKIGNVYSSSIVGLLLLAALIFNISMLPYPIWFKMGSLLVIPAALVGGSCLSMPRKTACTGKDN